jgi:hypothetical protein
MRLLLASLSLPSSGIVFVHVAFVVVVVACGNDELCKLDFGRR